MSNFGRKTNSPPTLQDRLQTLLLNLTSTSKILQKWPDSQGDKASIHIDTTTKLIHALQRITQSLKQVEDKSLTRLASDDNRDIELKKKLREYQVPLDLVDLMDYGYTESDSHNLFGLNPDCFIRGLLREALRQLSGLKRRKVALEMLGKAIEKGIVEKKERMDLESKIAPRSRDSVSTVPDENHSETKKKKRDRSERGEILENEVAGDIAIDEPATKRRALI